MAIVINGSGTVTGLAVGGLPDGTVDAGTLATDSVVTGKIADGTIANADINASAAIAGTKLAEISWGAIMSGDFTASSGAWHDIPLNTESWDIGSNYNTTNYRFTVPTGGAGRYLVSSGMEMTSVHSDKIAQICLRVNGSARPGSCQRDYTVSGDNDDVKFTCNTIFNLADGDYVTMTVYQNTGSNQLIAAGETFFGGEQTMSTIKSSAENLTLNADGANNDIKFQSNGSEVASISDGGVITATSFAGSGAALTGVGVDGISSSANANAITIDSSENVMVNKTSQDMAVVGAQFRGDATGLLQVTRTGGEALHLNRLSSDGNVLSVYKDTTLKGSIAVTAAGIGIQLGGTGAANTLEDYEEGTWTPTLSGSGGGTGTWASSVNTYTKVGRAVHFTAYLQCTSLGNASNAVIIGGLPFTNAAAGGYQAIATGAASGLAIGAGNCVTAFIDVNATTIHPRLWNATTGTAVYGFYVTELTADGNLMFSGTYFAT